MINKIYIVMGVSGCGKSTIGKLLADTLQIPFFDGDDFHPEENVKKMKNGFPLNDDDRTGWLQTLNTLSINHASKKGAVIACSALKKSYRNLLREQLHEKMSFVYLEGSYDEILSRVQQRKDHYMPANLLKSQFEVLEPPINALTVSIDLTPQDIVTSIIQY